MTARARLAFTCLALCAASIANTQPSALASTAAQAGDDPRFTVEKLTDNLELPAGFAFVPDGRIFILEKAGRIKIWKDGVLYARPLLDIRDEVNEFVDRGLLGIAIDPQFTRNGHIYLSYVYDPPGAAKDNEEPRKGRVVRYTVSGDIARPNSAQIILDDFSSDTQQHSVGSLRFAPDGALFASFGDGALSQGVQDISLGAQKLDNIQGKLLRMDTNGNGLKGNPFFDEQNPRSARSRIWAYGFRNPFRFSVHPQTGVPYVGDVGWNTYEWLMRATPGANFGWPCVEGSDNSPDYQAKPECKGVTAASTARKEIVYPHAGAPASITGGGFNVGDHFPADTKGDLFFADYSKFFVRRAKLDSQGKVTGVFDVIGNIGEPVDLQFGPDGALYVMSYQSRGFMRIKAKDKAPGSLAVAGATVPAPLRISGAGDGDTLLPGTRVTLNTTASSAYWQVSAHAGRGRASQNLARGDGSSISFEMPKTLGDDGYVEVLLAAPGKSGVIDSARLTLFAPHSDGYIRSWWLAGNTPWFDLNMDGLGNESSFAPKLDDKRAWLIRSPTRHVDLRRYITPSPGVFGVLADKAIAYAFVWIDVPEDRTGLLGMNSDDGLAAWLNGKEIWRNKVGRTMPDDLRDIDLPPITLKKGRNALLIKVDTYGGDWQFKVRVLNPDGSIMRDVQVRTEGGR